MGGRGAHRLSPRLGRRLGRRLGAPGVVLLALAASALTACTPEAAEHATTPLDLQRSERVWDDPWIAPDNLVSPSSAYGSNGFVTREAGSRTTMYAGGQRAAARIELRAARQRGWQLHGAECTPEGILVELTRGSGLDDGALARIHARPEARRTEVDVVGLVPHHADGSWPDPGAGLSVSETCLGGGDAVFEPFIDQGEPLEGSGAEDPLDDFGGWRREQPDDDEQALVEEVQSDPWFTSNGGELSDPRLRSGDNSRFGPTARVTVPRSGITSAEAARTAIDAMKQWQLTWVSCSRGTLTATLRLRVEHGVAVARVQVSPAEQRDVVIDLTLPAVETPPLGTARSAPVLERSRCLDGTATGRRLTIEGEPVAVTNHVQPLPDERGQ